MLRKTAILTALILAGSAALAAEPTDMRRPNTNEPEADTQYQAPQRVCQVFAGGVVKIDGKYSAWREDWCGSLSRASKAAACEPNNQLKLWRLYWNSTFWIYLKMKTHSPTVTALCPPGAEAAAKTAGVWNSMPAREDDIVLASKH
jgi:hypothetical protein